MADKHITRRKFMRDAAVGAAGIAVGLSAADRAVAAKKLPRSKRKIRNYNPNMEYRRLGKTNLWVSAVCLGGHWKRVNVMNQDLGENRRDVVGRCIEAGMNYIDITGIRELLEHSKALAGRRDKMYLALSDTSHEPRNPDFRTARKLLKVLDAALKRARLEYTDLWRITAYEPGGRHSFNTSCEIIAALEQAKKQGKTRFTGIASHDRRWLKFMVEHFNQLEVVLFPYTARTKKVPKGSIFDALQNCDVGAFGIKPFASNSLFKGSGAPNGPYAEEDDRRARLAIRYILCNPHIIPIPGLISPHQVDNIAKAVKERRELDLAETKELKNLMDQTWAKLPQNYQWLKNWEYV